VEIGQTITNNAQSCYGWNSFCADLILMFYVTQEQYLNEI